MNCLITNMSTMNQYLTKILLYGGVLLFGGKPVGDWLILADVEELWMEL